MTNRRKVLFFFSLVILSAVLTLGALLFFSAQNRKRITSQNREYLRDHASQVAANVDSALQDGYDNIQLLSLLLGNSLRSSEVDIASLQKMTRDSIFDFVEFADPEGMDHNITGGVSDAHDREYWYKGMAGETGMELIHYSRATHETLLMFYSPVVYDDETVGSLVGVYQASNRITKLLSLKLFEYPVTSYLCTADGRVIAGSVPVDPAEEIYLWDTVNDRDAAAEVRDAVSAGRECSFSLDGNRIGGCMVILPETDWLLLEYFPEGANSYMVNRATAMGVYLTIALLLVYSLVLAGMFFFFRSQRRQIEAADQAKTTFLFNMSHDIRTPMNAIIGYTALAQKHIQDSNQVTEFLSKIDISCKQLLALVNQVLDMSRIESGKIVLEENPVDLLERTKAMITIADASASKKGIRLTGIEKSVTDSQVYADNSRLSQLLLNILGNAVKYTPEGGSIDFILEQLPCSTNGRGRYSFTIRDTGIGMSPKFLKHIYDPFSRENNSTISKVEGTGLGMAIVKRLADLMDADLSIESVQGQGTTVKLTMTLRLQGKTTTRRRTAQLEDENDSEPINKAELFGRRVLLVDDIEMNREIAKDILEDYGLLVETAEDGEIAVKMFSVSDPDYYDFILMDVQMPCMNGYEATRAIRLLPGGHSIPIIAMTANAFEEDRTNAFAAGMDAHIAKPVDIKKLIQTLAEL